MSISQAILNTLIGEWHNNIRNFATIINENIQEIAMINDDNDRYKKIIELLNFEEPDMNKIIKQPNRVPKIIKENQQNKNNNNNSQLDEVKTSKKSGRKITECPIPFWCVFENDNIISSTIIESNCQALKNPLYNQCVNSKSKNSDYCSKCCKTINENGIPKHGNISMRIQQFKRGNYKFNTPDNIEKKIYFRDYCDKKNFTSEDLSKILRKNNINLNDNEIEKIMYKREKKATGRKPKKMEQTKNDENEDENNDNDNDNDDDDDTKSVDTNFTEQTEQTENEDEENEKDITKYGTIKTSTGRFGILLEDKKKIMQMTKDAKDGKLKMDENKEIFNLFEINDYINETSFSIEDFDTPVAFFKSGKIVKIE